MWLLLTSACLLLSLTGCASSPIVKTRTVTVSTPVIVAVPKAYTQPVPMPALKAGPVTNRDVWDYVLALKQALRDANAKLAKIAGLK